MRSDQASQGFIHWVLKTSNGGDCTITLGNLLQYSAVFVVKRFLLISNLSHFNSCPLFLILLPCTAVKSLPSTSSWPLCKYRKAATKPPLLQATQVQFPQPPLTEQVLQPLTTSAEFALGYHSLSYIEGTQNWTRPISAVNWRVVPPLSCIS